MLASRKVLFVTQQFAPEPIGSGPYMAEMAAFAADQGAEVTVFTCRPFYPDDAVGAAYRDGSRDDERKGRLRVVRVAPWLPHKRGAIGRILSEGMFLLRGLAALAGRILKRHETVVSLCPSIFSVLLGNLATRRGGRHVAVVHDIQSGLASGLGMVRSGHLVRIMRWLERQILNRADLVLVLSETMRAQLLAQGVRTPIAILPIWVDTEAVKPMPSPREDDTPVVLYSGNLGRKQGLDQIVEMAKHLKRRKVAARVVIRGAGSEAANLAARVEYEGLDNVEFRPLVSKSNLGTSLAEGDILLVPQNGRIADFAVPSKIFAIMAAGRPFIAAAPPGSLLWKMREKSHSHLCVAAGDAKALADAVERLTWDPTLRDELGRNGRDYAVRHHDRKVVLGQFAAFLTGMGGPDTADGRHAVVFEPDARGHTVEWLRHLISHIRDDPAPIRLTLAVPGRIADVLRTELPAPVDLHILSDREEAWCMHRRLIVSAFARWATMRRALKASGASHGIFLGIDHVSLPLALNLPMAGRRLSGILFRPTTHYRADGCGEPTRRERLRDLRKDILLHLLIRRKDVTRVFSLDPFFPAFAARRHRHGDKVVALSDPAFPITVAAAADRKIAEGLPAERTTFLLFGEITARKGVFQLIDALYMLPHESARQVTVVIAGRLDPGIRHRVIEATKALQLAQPDLLLELIDRHLRSGEIYALVRRCDVVLAPYQRFVGSSGILLWAAKLARPVISQEYGLVGKLTRCFGLGVAVDTSDPRVLSQAIQMAGRRGAGIQVNPSAVSIFVKQRSPRAFSSALLSANAF